MGDDERPRGSGTLRESPGLWSRSRGEMRKRRGKDCPQWSRGLTQSDSSPSPRNEEQRRPGLEWRQWPPARGGELETFQTYLKKMLQSQRQQGERIGSSRK